MRSAWVKVQTLLLVGVLASGVGALFASGGSQLTLAGPEVLRLIQNAHAALADYPAIAMTMHMKVTAGGQSISVTEHGLTSPDGKTGIVSIKLPNGAGSLRQFVADGAIYAPAVPGHYPAIAGKHWLGLKVPMAASRSPFPTGSDPIGYLSMLPGATGPVQVLGHDRVAGGVSTTHYRVSLDVAKALQSQPAQLRQAQATEGLAQLRQDGITTQPVDLWFDSNNALRQFRISLHLGLADTTMTMDLSGSNQPVNVKVPAPSDTLYVSDITELETFALGRS
jgi:hypothetical protein